MWDKLFAGADLLQKGMSAAWTRNAVIRNNIANAETPGFKASDLEFENLFAAALEESGAGFAGKKTREKHRDIGEKSVWNVDAAIYQRTDTSMRVDGNNVDIDAENVKLAKNAIYYNTLMEKLNGELARIKLAVNDGR